MRSIRYIASEQSSQASRLVEFPWVSDGIVTHEMRALGTIAILLFTWSSWSVEDSGLAEALFDQVWFKDGLSKEEAAVVTVLKATMCLSIGQVYYGLIQNPQVRSETLSLPGGKVELYAIRQGSGLFEGEWGEIPDSVFRQLRTGIEAIGDFLGPPWITSNVIVYLEPSLSYFHGTANGFNFGGDGVTIREQPDTPEFKEVLYHELAHYHTINGHFDKWLGEGAAEFLASYTLHASEGASLRGRQGVALELVRDYCQDAGLTSIRNVLVRRSERHPPWQVHYCPYPPGESFLLALYDRLGHETVESSLRELYRLGKSNESPLSEGRIYQALLSNVAPAQQDEFRSLYVAHHGGPAGYSPDIDVAPNPDGASLAALYHAPTGPVGRTASTG